MARRDRPIPHQPVGAALTHEAEASFDEQRRRFWKRTDRRLAKTAAGIFGLLTMSFCGAGYAVNYQSVSQRQHYVAFEQVRAEYDCCAPGAPPDERCAEAIAHLDALHEDLAGGPSLSWAVATWIKEITGLQPEADMPLPGATEVEALHAQCHAVPRSSR